MRFSVKDKEKYKYTYHICEKTLKLFEDSGVNVESSKLLMIYFDTSLNYPIFLPGEYNNDDNDKIGIKMADDSYWCQLIYQLSHELCHYVIYLNNHANYNVVNWLEESICEAFSLYCLHYWMSKWRIIGFKINQKYNEEIKKYLKDITEKLKNKNQELSLTDDINESILKEINSVAQSKRNRRGKFVCELSNKIKKESLIGLINYQKYVLNEVFVDTKNYYSKFNNDAVEYICSIQDKIMWNSRCL